MTKSPAIGIDLGTSYCSVGVFKNGFVEIIPNDRGNRKIPTLVCFKDSERFIGDDALEKLTQNSVNAVYETKRIIGRKYEDKFLQEDMKHWPFIVTNVDGKTKISVNFGKEDFFPEEVTSWFLSKMKETAESYLGQEVTKAVITVPAHFNDSQRQATKDAATIAGLNDEESTIINEPTAAAITYKINSASYLVDTSKERTILIFDFGGGTIDVSVVTMKKKKIIVKSTAGNTHLGGVDIDDRLVNHFVEEFKQKHQEDISQNQKSLAKLRICVEKAKRILSACPSVPIEVISICKEKDLSSTLTITQFNDLCDDLFKSTLRYVEDALIGAQLEQNNIDEVVLVGGSSRIPRVQNLLQAFFKGKNLNKTINLDEAVANGAAIQAAILSGHKSKTFNGLNIRNVNPFSIEFRNRVIFRSNCQLPIHRSIKVKTKTIKIASRCSHVCEKISGNEQNILQQIIFNKFDSEDKEDVKFDLKFSIDINGILRVKVENKSEKVVGDIQVTNANDLLSEKQVNMLAEKTKEYKLQDEKKKEKMKRIILLEERFYDMSRKMQNFRQDIPDDDREKVIKAYDELTVWIKQDEEVELEKIEEMEKEFESIFDRMSIYLNADLNLV